MSQEILTSRFLKKHEMPNFRSLNELKAIFKNSPIIPDDFQQLHPLNNSGFNNDLIIRIDISKGNFIDFRIMQLVLGTFWLLQPPKICDMLNNGQIDLLIKTLSQDRKSKLEIVLSNVLEPTLDVELVISFPGSILDCLFNAIISGLKDNQAAIEQILQMPEDQLYEVAQIGKEYRTPPSEMLIQGVTCSLTRWVIDSNILKIVRKREGRELPL